MILFSKSILEFRFNINYREERFRRLNIAEFAGKTYAVSRFLAGILPVPTSLNVPISPNFIQIFITNYFVGVINDVNLMIQFLKFILFNYYLIAFGGVLNSTHFGDSLNSN